MEAIVRGSRSRSRSGTGSRSGSGTRSTKKSKRKKCPNGTKQNKGECEPYTPVEKTVTLLGQNNLFQVSFDNFDKIRLKTYEPAITVPSLEGAQQSGSITLINSMVALGLLDSDKAKEYTDKVKKHVIDPVELLPDVFDMNRGSVTEDGVMDGRGGFTYIEEELNIKLAELQPNYATLLRINCSNHKDFPSSSDWVHYIIAFKDKSKRKTGIKYYDPQSKRFMSSLKELFPENQLLSKYLDKKGSVHHKDSLIARQIKNDYLFEIYSCLFYRVSSSENRTLKRIDKISVKDDSPTTGYFNIHFSNPVKMLGGTSLVQFSVTPEQFDDYVNFTHASFESGMNCVLHSLFSLGLRNSTQVKRDSMRMYDREYEEQGIYLKKIARYLAKIAGLPRGSIIVLRDANTVLGRPLLRFIDKKDEGDNIPLNLLNDLKNKNFDKMIDRYLKKHLINNHATLIFVCYKYLWIGGRYPLECHSIVAYKRNNKVEFFDPQTDKENAGRSTVKDCMDPYNDLLFENFQVLAHSTPLEHDILIDDDRSCHIPFSGSPNVSPDSPFEKFKDRHASIR